MRVNGDQPVPRLHDIVVNVDFRIFRFNVKGGMEDFCILEVVLSKLIVFWLEPPTIGGSSWIVLTDET